MIMKYISLFVALLILASCSENKMQNVVFSEKEIFFPDFYWGDTLYLNVRIDDCGEWGGPEDNFIISKDSLRHFAVDFKRYKMNCDSISEYYGKDKPHEFEKKFILNEKKQTAVSDFLVDLMKAKIEEEVRSNAGCIYNVFNNDSTLSLRVYSTQKNIEEEYYNFKKDLGLPENRKKEEEKVSVTYEVY